VSISLEGYHHPGLWIYTWLLGLFGGPSGDIRLQVESSSSFRIPTSRFQAAVLVFVGGAFLVPFMGCHRSPGPDVVATVNGKDIPRSDLDRAYQNFRISQGSGPQEPSPEQASIMKLELLGRLIDAEILQQQATKISVAASDEDVNARLTEMKAPFTQEEFDKQLKDRNESLDDLKKDIRHDLTEQKLLNKEIESKINITDAEISNYYAAHKAEWNFIENQVHLAQIVVTTAPAQQTGNLQNNKASGEADAKKKITALHQKLENGEAFDAVAMQYSEDPNTSSSGGDRGLVPESALHSDPEAYNEISKLKPGQFTDVLPIYDAPNPGHHIIGYAIYKLIGREPAGQRDLNDPRIQQIIRQGLREIHAQLLKRAYFEMLRDDAKVHNYLADDILKEGAH
jgi:peptidyl-prolyl cis-trans isomerase SurA